MKIKTLKSKQVVCETPSIEWSCGGGCFGLDSGNAYNWLEDIYYCEDCGQEWKLPKGVELVVKFKRTK